MKGRSGLSRFAFLMLFLVLSQGLYPQITTDPKPSGDPPEVGEAHGYQQPKTGWPLPLRPFTVTKASLDRLAARSRGKPKGLLAEGETKRNSEIKAIEERLLRLDREADITTVELQKALQEQQRLVQMAEKIEKLILESNTDTVRKEGG